MSSYLDQEWLWGRSTSARSRDWVVTAGAGSAAHREPLLEVFSFAGWRKPLLETLGVPRRDCGVAAPVRWRRRRSRACQIPIGFRFFWLPVNTG